MKKIFILTGEPSGDKLASEVISEIKKKKIRPRIFKCWRYKFTKLRN